MLTRRWLLAGIAVLLFAVLVAVPVQPPAHAQNDDWSVTLLRSGQGADALLRVYADGSTQSYDLGLDENQYVSAQAITFTRGGESVAYCVNSGSGADRTSTVFLRDIASGDIRWQRDVGATVGCVAAVFDANDSRLAVGIINRYPGGPDADSDRPIWRLLLLDATSGEIAHEIASDTTTLPLESELTGILPRARYIGGDTVTFTAVPWGTEAGFDLPAFHWNTATGAIDPATYWGRTGQSYLPGTGEFAWTGQNPDLPAVENAGPAPVNNIVRYAEIHDAPARTIYYTADWLPLATAWIDGGARLAVYLTEPFAPPAEGGMAEPQTVRWIAIARDGSTEELLSAETYAEVRAAPGGFVALTAASNEDFTRQEFELRYAGGDGLRTLWSTAVENASANYNIVYVTPDAPARAADLPPFPAVQP